MKFYFFIIFVALQTKDCEGIQRNAGIQRRAERRAASEEAYFLQLRE